jgi:hypothetical protein
MLPSVAGGASLGQRIERQAFRIGGGRHFGAGEQGAGETVADGGVFAAESDSRRIAIMRRLHQPAVIAHDHGARGGRRRFALGNQEQIARTGTAFLERADREALSAQRRDERILLAQHRCGRENRSH